MSEIQDSMYDEFTENFIKAIIGIDLKIIPQHKQQKTVVECIEIFMNFTYAHLKEHEDFDYAMYFKAVQNLGECSGYFEDEYKKFLEEFSEAFEATYEEFLEQIEMSWDDSDYKGYSVNIANLKSYKPSL
jgi:hypothetical protein